MSLRHKIRAAFSSLRRARAERELAAELRFHLDSLIEQHMQHGLTRAQAQRAACLELGGEEQVREACREVRWFAPLQWLIQDSRFALRLFFKDRAFTSAALFTLALGLGVNLTAFNVFNIVMLRPLAVHEPETLVRLGRQSPTSYSSLIAYPAMQEMERAAAAQPFPLTAVMGSLFAEHPVDGDLHHRANILLVSPNYFSELGAGAAYGRVFHPQLDKAPFDEPRAVLGHAFWKRRYGSDPAIVGKTIRINLKPAAVIGVAPYDFTGLASTNVDVWLLLPQLPYFTEGSRVLSDWENEGVQVHGRLRRGLALKAAEEALLPLVQDWRRTRPNQFREGESIALTPAGYLSGGSAGQMRPEEMALAAMIVSLFLLILIVACTNLGNLLLARGIAREREITTRYSLGASRTRVISQLMAESLLLAIFGVLAGVGFGYAAMQVLRALMDTPAHFQFFFDGRMALFSLALAVLATFFFGLTPAIHSVRRDPRRKNTARRVLIALQVAASCVLLIVSALLARSLNRALYGTHGFEYQNIIAVDPGLRSHGHTDASASSYLHVLLERTSAVPGVTSIALTTIPPLGDRVAITSADESPATPTYISQVTPDFFATMSIPILRGRVFAQNEGQVAIVSTTLAEKLWPGRDPLGQKVLAGQLTVIGVAGAARTASLRDGDATELYTHLRSEGLADAVLLAKVSSSPEAFIEAMRATALAVNSGTVPTVTLLKESFTQRIRPSQDMALVISCLGAMAALLSAMGVFGLISYAVSQKQKEIGVRMALGADSADVLGAVMRQFAMPLGIGLIAGIALAAGLSVALRRELFGLSNWDPLSYATAILLFALVTVAASAVPVRRALRSDPSVVLRHD